MAVIAFTASLVSRDALAQQVSAWANGNDIVVAITNSGPNSGGCCTYALTDADLCPDVYLGGHCSMPCPRSDTYTFSCNTVGVHQVEGCWNVEGVNHPVCSAPIPVTVTVPPSTPPYPYTIVLSIVKNTDGTYAAKVRFPGNSINCATGALNELVLLPTASEPGQTYFTQSSFDGGDFVIPLGTFDTTRTIEAKQTGCGGLTAVADATITCNKCKGPATSTPDPIRLFDGVMTHSETDPLPVTFGFEFRREYASSAALDGRFGLGWSSVFDAGAGATDGSARRVTVVTEDRSHATYVANSTGGWSQAWPLDGIGGTLSGSEASGYTFRDANGTLVRTFDAAHHLTRFQDLRRGQAVSITYDSNGWPTHIFDEAGMWSATITTGNGHVTQIAVDGRPDLTWTYTYTGSLLTSVSVAGAPSAWRTYDYVNNRLTTVTDATGTVIVRHDYDASGRAISSYDADGGDITNIAYGSSDSNGVSSTIITRPDNSQATYDQSFAGGSVVTQHVDHGCSACGLNDATAVYDTYGNVTRLQNGRGYITESSYTNGRQLFRTITAEVPSGCDPTTDPSHCRLSSAALATATLVRTAASQSTAYVHGDPNWPSQPTQITRDGVEVAGSTTTETFAFDVATGEVLVHTRTGAIDSQNTQESHTTTTTLYGSSETAAFAPGGDFQSAWLALPQPVGLRKSVDGPRTDASDMTTFVYYPIDSSVPAPWRGRLAGVRDALGHITRYTGYDVFGNPGTVTDPNSVITRSTFDALGRVLTTTIAGIPGCDTGADPLCTTDLTTTRTYASTTGPLLSEARPSGDVTAYTYDTRGRILTMTRGTASTPMERATYTYDPTTGKKSSETLALWTNGTWVDKKTESYTYLSDGNLSSVLHADNTAVHYAYLPDGTLGSIQDENHTAANTTYDYDPANRLSKVTQTLATAPGGQAITQYTYDVAGNLTAITDANNNTTTYEYDDFGRLQRQVSPVSGTTTYAYDPAGNLLSTTDANTASTTRTYDALNRALTAVSTRDGNTETVSWTYDDTTAYGIGRLATSIDPTGSTVYQYERRGLVRAEARSVNGTQYTTSYTYDANGNRNRTTYPSGLVAQYTFDFADRPATLTAGTTSIVTSASYLPFGPRTSVTFGNGTTRTMQYDNRYRPQENKLVGPGGTIADYTYQEDNVGNITQLHDATDTSYNRDFGYDDLNRLTTANTGASLWGSGTYTYDAMGNMKTAALGTWKQASMSLVGTTPKLSSVTENGTVRSVAYDSAGNEITAGTASFTYSPRNSLIAANVVTYVYDGRGVLTISSVPAILLSLPTSIRGGNTGTGTVALYSALAYDTTVTLSSDSPSIGVPETVTISAGTVSTTFTITTTPVAGATSGTIHATSSGLTAAASLTVLPPQLATFTVSPTSSQAGYPVTATVTLDATAVTSRSVTIDGFLVEAPATLVIPAGTTSASMSVTPVRLYDVTSMRTLTATLDEVSLTTTMTVTPPVISTLSLTPTSVVGGDASTAQATVTGTAQFMPMTGMTVPVTSSNPAIAGGDGGIVFPGYQYASTSGSGRIITGPVLSTSSVTLTGTTGTVSRSAAITLQPAAVTLSTFTISPTSIVGTNPVNGTVTLTAPAPTGGLDVELTTNNSVVAPAIAFVHVNAGSTSATFQINTAAVGTTTASTITATHAATSRSANVTVSVTNGPYLSALTAVSGSGPISNVPNGVAVEGGLQTSFTASVQLGGGTGRASVALSSSNSSVVSVPKSVTVSSGATTATFTITAAAVGTAATVKVTATYNGTTQNLFVTVVPYNAVTIATLAQDVTQIQGTGTPCATVSLTGAAPAAGALINISGGRPGIVTVPATITIPYGATSGCVPLTSYTFLGTPHAMDLTATYAGITQTRRIPILPVTLSSNNERRRPVQCAALSLAPCLTAAELRAVATAVGDAARYYLYTPELQLLAETEQTTTNTKPIAWSYIWFGTEPIAQIDNASSIRWYATDHLGTPFLQTDASGNVIWRVERTPYGETFSSRVGASQHQPLKFPGQFSTDTNTDEYNVFRWYRSTWGQYTQSDPLLSVNRRFSDFDRVAHYPYTYSDDAPTMLTDPRGLFAASGDLTYDEMTSLVKANNQSGQNTQLILCIAWKESSFNYLLTNPSSSARGLMQVTKGAAAEVGANHDYMFEPSLNIQAGSAYLALRIKWAKGNVAAGLDGYGTGPGYSTNLLTCETCLNGKPKDPQCCLDKIHK
jgi:RHS repeat-associated protein